LKYLRWNKNRVFYNEEDILDSVNKNNGKTKCLISLYGFTDLFDGRPDYNSIIIDKILIEGKYEALKKIYNLLNNQFNTMLTFDGKKFFLFLFLDEELEWPDLKPEAEELDKLIQEKYPNLTGYQINTEHEKLILIPNTWNPSTQKFVVSFKNHFPTKEEIIARSVDDSLWKS